MRKYWPFAAPLVSAVPAMTIIILLIAPPADAAEFRNRLLAGYDSFIDRFTLIEEDTTETVHDLYAGIDNFFLREGDGTKLSLRNLFKFGNQTIDDDFSGVFNAGTEGNWLLQLRADLRFKIFREGSDYEFGNDYAQSNLHLKLGRRIGDSWYLLSKTRAELTRFDEKTQFDYNYNYFDTGLGAEAGSYFGRFLRVFARAGHREAPDTTDLSFDRFLGETEARFSDGPVSLELSAYADRRDYSGASRSDYWFIYSTGALTWTEAGGTSVTGRAEAELLYYDYETRTWFNNQFLRGSVRVRIPLTGISYVYAEPRIAVMRCESFEEERYRELSVVLGTDVMGSEHYWLTFSWEPGYRSYILEENLVYSDFSFNRLSLMASGTLGERYGANIFISHDPEKHTRRTDDFTITMVSASVSIRF
jgi:hypothetical protein